MAVFYIDFENVSNQGLNGIEKLLKDDTVKILYSDSSNCIHFDCVEKIINAEAKIEFIKADHGTPNALDFQMVALMFIKIKMDEDTYIVSKDNGFDAAIKLGKKQGYEKLYRISEIDAIFKKDIIPEPDNPLKDKVDASLPPMIVKKPSSLTKEELVKNAIAGTPGVSKKNRPIVYDALSSSKGKADFYRNIIKILGQKDGLTLYKLVKGHFSEWKQMQN